MLGQGRPLGVMVTRGSEHGVGVGRQSEEDAFQEQGTNAMCYRN